MATLTTVSISLESDLLKRLDEAASLLGLTREAMVRDAVEQQLEVALRHRVVLARLEAMDTYIVALAEFIAETAAPASAEQVASFCRYKPSRQEPVE